MVVSVLFNSSDRLYVVWILLRSAIILLFSGQVKFNFTGTILKKGIQSYILEGTSLDENVTLLRNLLGEDMTIEIEEKTA